MRSYANVEKTGNVSFEIKDTYDDDDDEQSTRCYWVSSD
jgi:hypothetical protein